jgi:hypothetical protein
VGQFKLLPKSMPLLTNGVLTIAANQSQHRTLYGVGVLASAATRFFVSTGTVVSR